MSFYLGWDTWACPTVSGLSLCALIILPLFYSTAHMKAFIHPPQPATLITTVLITSNHWHLHLIRQGLQRLIVSEPCVLGRKHCTEIPNRMFCASVSFCGLYCVSSEHFWLFIYCFFSSLCLFAVRQWKHVHEYARAQPGLCAREPGGLITAHSFCFKS